jgi:SNF2 family DNA or RNA helicase
LKLTPDPAQAEAIATLAADTGPGAIVGAEIGAGKTLITVEGALERFAKRVLVVAPLPVFENWDATFAAQTDGAVRLRACGKTKYADIPARELKANLDDFMAGKDGFYFMGREFWVTQDWYTSNEVDAKGNYRRKQRHAYKKHPVDVLIFDEAHFAASRDSRGYKTFMYHPATYKCAVTGTYFGNKFENAYTIPNAIWGNTLKELRSGVCATRPRSSPRTPTTASRSPASWSPATG